MSDSLENKVTDNYLEHLLHNEIDKQCSLCWGLCIGCGGTGATHCDNTICNACWEEENREVEDRENNEED